MTITSTAASAPAGPVILDRDVDGIAVVPDTPLTWTNFFDGRPMRAADFTAEQQAGIDHTRLAARAGGMGVGWGYEVTRPTLTQGQPGETLWIDPGLAYDPDGRALYLTQRVELTIPELLAASSPPRPGPRAEADAEAENAEFQPCGLEAAPPVAASPSGTVLYLLTVGWVQGRCGSIEVFGQACAGGCGGSCGGGCSRGSDRPFRIDGVVFRLRPLTLHTSWEVSGAFAERHLRSRVASAVFADERETTRWPLSAALLASDWWRGGTRPPVGAAGADVPLALVARRGGVTMFVDVWAARRERTDLPARPAFDARITARPRAIFAAQVDQFQAQLAESGSGLTAVSSDQLFSAGFVELPSVGFLPVDPARSLPAQCAALFGDQVSVELVPVSRDQIPHELEAAAHRDRIPLRTAAPAGLPEVDVLVPDGSRSGGLGDVARLFALEATLTQAVGRMAAGGARFLGSGRRVDRGDGGLELYAAAIAGVTNALAARVFVQRLAEPARDGDPVLADRALDEDLIDLIADHAAAAAQRLRTGLIDAGILTARLKTQQGKPIAAWLELVTDVAPWRAPDGRKVKVEWTLQVSAPTGREGVTTTLIRASGQLTPQAPATPNARSWTFAGSVRLVRNADEASKEVSVDVEQVRSGPAWEFRIGGAATISLFADPAPAERIELGFRQSLTAALALSPDVADPANPNRASGERSLAVLRLAPPVDEAEYQRRRNELFGEADVADRPTVTGPYDWVAFRRSTGGAPLPVPAPPDQAPPPAATDTVQVAVRTVTRAAPAPPDQAPPPAATDTVQVAVRTVTRAAEIDAVVKEAGTAAGSPPTLLTVNFRPNSSEFAGDSRTALQDEVADAIQGIDRAQLHLIGFAPGDLSQGADRARAVAEALQGIAPPADGTAPRTVHIDRAELGGALGRIVLVAGPPRLQTTLDFVAILHGDPAVNRVWEKIESALANGDAGLLADTVKANPNLVILSLALPATEDDVQRIREKLASLSDGWRLADLTPMLLIDRDWASQDQPSADPAEETAKRVLDGLETPQGVRLSLVDSRRPALPESLSRAVVVLLRTE